MRLARLGAQRALVTNMFLNRAPSRAIRSVFGVWRNGWPSQERKSYRWSSVIMTTRFGRRSAATAGKAAATSRQAERVRTTGLQWVAGEYTTIRLPHVDPVRHGGRAE